jgi:glycyl-tRNA synthetase beta chain
LLVPDFLLELRCEEIPARMQAGARADLEKLFRKEMDAAGVAVGELTLWSTPRRLALIARDLPAATAAVSEELKGPRVGAPPQALEGFLRKTGLSEDQLTERDGVLYAITEKPGRATAAVLAEAIPGIVRAFPWPKSQRWGAASLSTGSLRWVRPLSGIVALFADALVPCEIGGINSGYATKGHRFHCPGEITIGSASDYQEKLRACHVIVDHVERQDLIRAGAKAAAEAAGLVLVEDEGLVIENAGLTEWPVPLLGRFDEAFLEVPPEVIQLTARTNQKYFVCTYPLQPPIGEGARPQDGGGVSSSGAANTPPPSFGGSPSPNKFGEDKLANAFVCTANISAADGGEAIVAGNRKVLAARLSDARFFWEQDRKKTLAQRAEGLARITFHEKLGSVADKVERVAKLARWLVEEGIVRQSSPSTSDGEGDRPKGGGGATPPSSLRDATSPSQVDGEDRERLAQLAEQAARLCKADLVTEMVGEFPELQGLMGGYYARAEGLPDAVADAIRDHYKPVGQGDQVPTAPVTVAVSLADKLDTLVGFFLFGLKPTGSKDPFALRRAAIAILQLLVANDTRTGLRSTILRLAIDGYQATIARAYFARFGKIAEAFDATTLDAKYQLLMHLQSTTEPRLEHDASDPKTITFELIEFLIDRLKVQQREAGVRHDLIDAVFALGGEDDLVRLLARVRALQAFVDTEDGVNLLAGYKRASNILKQAGSVSGSRSGPKIGSVSGSGTGSKTRSLSGSNSRGNSGSGYELELAEQVLIDALAIVGPKAATAIAVEDFAAAMAALASLRAPIDAFFDNVTVNDADQNKRAARLSLLAGFRDAVHSVADFSKIEG